MILLDRKMHFGQNNHNYSRGYILREKTKFCFVKLNTSANLFIFYNKL